MKKTVDIPCVCARNPEVLRQQYAAAKKAGEALLKKMTVGKGKWKVDLWENLGWHLRLRNGPLTLYCPEPWSGRKNRAYTVFVSGHRSSDGHGGSGLWMAENLPRFSDPNVAVEDALRYVERTHRQLTRARNRIRKAAETHRIALRATSRSQPRGR